MILKTTPIFVVSAIEPNLALWTERLGYVKVAEVPHGDALGFVILVREGLELMMQTTASLGADVPAVAARVAPGAVVLYHEVSSLEAMEAATMELELLVPRRETFYGTREIFVATRDGQVLGFSEKLPEREG